MTGKTHAMVGANAVWFLALTDLAPDPWLIPLGAFTALLPDLDASESMAKHLEVGFGTRRSRVAVKPLAPLAFVLSRLFRHRGWLHSWLAVVVVAGVSVLALGRYGPAYPLVATLGYLSHLAIDALTKSGIDFLLPLRSKVALLPKPFRVRTGGAVDMGLFLVGALTLVLLAMRIAHGQAVPLLGV